MCDKSYTKGLAPYSFSGVGVSARTSYIAIDGCYPLRIFSKELSARTFLSRLSLEQLSSLEDFIYNITEIGNFQWLSVQGLTIE